MTSNQINYWKNVEAERSNRSNEAITSNRDIRQYGLDLADVQGKYGTPNAYVAWNVANRLGAPQGGSGVDSGVDEDLGSGMAGNIIRFIGSAIQGLLGGKGNGTVI